MISIEQHINYYLEGGANLCILMKQYCASFGGRDNTMTCDAPSQLISLVLVTARVALLGSEILYPVASNPNPKAQDGAYRYLSHR